MKYLKREKKLVKEITYFCRYSNKLAKETKCKDDCSTCFEAIKREKMVQKWIKHGEVAKDSIYIIPKIHRIYEVLRIEKPRVGRVSILEYMRKVKDYLFEKEG